MSESIRVIQYGLGAIGRAAARLVMERPHLELVGAVDSSPDFAGGDVGRVIESGRDLGFTVDNSLAAALDGTEADAVIHCTGSSFAVVYDQLAEIVGEGLSCVTSCEEALFPRYRNPELAEELNNLCVSHSVGVLGTGVNPGFVMDTLPVLLTAVSQGPLDSRAAWWTRHAT
jgi:4-hydroxy-tetrahydrodipicolinate reductase